MPAEFVLRVVTPDEVFFEGKVEHVRVPAALGYLGILKDHAPLVSPIQPGNLSFRDAGKNVRSYKIQSGFLEVLNNRVLVLTDSISK
jgi:F-type H+-transporting ATPase subunit epsilon